MPQATRPSVPQSIDEPRGRQKVKTSALTGDDAGAVSSDGTLQLLRAGLAIFVIGLVAVLLTETVLGGIGVHGPQTESGWLALIVALMCLPFGLMLLALGSAKWLRNRRISSGARR
jgi:hypothetical protein